MIRDVLRGICSGIPLCCIAWFAAVWATPRAVAVPLQGAFMRGWRARYAQLSTRREYVPCPICLIAERRVEIRDCRDGCLCAGVGVGVRPA